MNADCPLSGGSGLFALGYIYELPFRREKRFSFTGPLDLVFGGWQVSGVFSYQNALPLRFTTSFANPV